jgi:hypothetical protein
MIDTTMPLIPAEIFNLAGEDADLTYSLRCGELWDEVVNEVLDPDFRSRQHHNVGTYDKSCRGPLCRKALREHPRRKSPSSAPYEVREERIYDPVIEYFHVVMKHRVRAVQQEILKEIRETG